MSTPTKTTYSSPSRNIVPSMYSEAGVGLEPCSGHQIITPG